MKKKNYQSSGEGCDFQSATFEAQRRGNTEKINLRADSLLGSHARVAKPPKSEPTLRLRVDRQGLQKLTKTGIPLRFPWTPVTLHLASCCRFFKTDVSLSRC